MNNLVYSIGKLEQWVWSSHWVSMGGCGKIKVCVWNEDRWLPAGPGTVCRKCVTRAYMLVITCTDRRDHDLSDVLCQESGYEENKWDVTMWLPTTRFSCYNVFCPECSVNTNHQLQHLLHLTWNFIVFNISYFLLKLSHLLSLFIQLSIGLKIQIMCVCFNQLPEHVQPMMKRIFEYIVFDLWTFSESKYYSNIQIFWSEYSEIIWWKNTWIFDKQRQNFDNILWVRSRSVVFIDESQNVIKRSFRGI